MKHPFKTKQTKETYFIFIVNKKIVNNYTYRFYERKAKENLLKNTTVIIYISFIYKNYVNLYKFLLDQDSNKWIRSFSPPFSIQMIPNDFAATMARYISERILAVKSFSWDEQTNPCMKCKSWIIEVNWNHNSGVYCSFLVFYNFKIRSSRLEVFCKKGVLKNFTKLTGHWPATLLKMRL